MLGALIISAPVATQAQSQCGTARATQFPVDTASVPDRDTSRAQSAPSGTLSHRRGLVRRTRHHLRHARPRHRRRAGDLLVAQRSGARPRRDIIQHNFPDGSTAYSMYGHVTDATGIPFPAVLSCVHQGDMIAAVGDIRPAPHLHFEIPPTSRTSPAPATTGKTRSRTAGGVRANLSRTGRRGSLAARAGTPTSPTRPAPSRRRSNWPITA